MTRAAKWVGSSLVTCAVMVFCWFLDQFTTLGLIENVDD